MLSSHKSLPDVYDSAKADDVLALLKECDHQQLLTDEAAQLSRSIFGNSPFLCSISRRFPTKVIDFLCGDPDTLFEQIILDLLVPRPAGEKDEEFIAFLRDQKNLAALLIAIADVAGAWRLAEVTRNLSNLAKLFLELAIARALRTRMIAGDLPWPEGLDRQNDISIEANRQSGYFILGLGKLGGDELNYSSDIDLIALYDPIAANYRGRKSVSDCFVKVTQDVVRYIDQRTMNGYVFRVDLRLRPDPGTTPVALSIEAALGYYHSIATNWERSAMIKAAFAAGDSSEASKYLDEMAHWVWRRNMDFEALKDIAAIKNQINRHYELEDATFEGFDVKLGVGGIREIEFYAQVNQLLHGGRNPSLRGRNTVKTLRELTDLELAPAKACRELIAAYEFLRMVEHRIQMTNDEQTHSIPEDETGIERLTSFLGYQNASEFRAELRTHTERVQRHYDDLLPDSAGEPTNMTEKQTRAALTKAGFTDTDAALHLIGSWKYGRYRSLKTNRARDLLGQCLPELLTAFGKAHLPDAALRRFDTFLVQLPSGVQLFSLLKSNSRLLQLLARIIGLAPALSSILAKRPGLWDAVLDPQFFEPVQNVEELRDDLRRQLSTARDFQDTLDFVRRFFAEQKFKTGVLMLEGIADAEEIGLSLSNVCDVIMQELIPSVEKEFAENHGYFNSQQQGIAMVALGKYGGQELTHTSDVDIIFLYDSVSEVEFSSGKKPLTPKIYYARLAQHIITAITALTPEGQLFDVDTRLRPSGSQGPLAVAINSFKDYYRSSAWTWEFLALTRARVIHAGAIDVADVQSATRQALSTLRPGSDITIDTQEMRMKLFEQFGTENCWEVKHVRGGLVDIEFICQFLVLRHASAHPDIIEANIGRCLAVLRDCRLLTATDHAVLIDGYSLQRTIQSVLRLCLEATPEKGTDIPAGLAQVLMESLQYSSIPDLENELRKRQKQCHALFIQIVADQKEK